MNELSLHCMLLVSYIQQYFDTSITVLTNQVWKLLIALFKVPNTGAFMVLGKTMLVVTSFHWAPDDLIFSLNGCEAQYLNNLLSNKQIVFIMPYDSNCKYMQINVISW